MSNKLVIYKILSKSFKSTIS